MVAEDYEAALRDAQAQREHARKLEVRVEDLVQNEEILQQTLTTAQKLSDELKRTAVKEAELLVGEAEVKAEKILDAAHRRAARLAEDIREMKLLRTRLSSSVRASIQTHLELLDGILERDEDEPAIASLGKAARDAKSDTREP
jgi:cell division initiation protein